MFVGSDVWFPVGDIDMQSFDASRDCNAFNTSPNRKLACVAFKIVHHMTARIRPMKKHMSRREDFKSPWLGIVPAGSPSG